MAALGSMVKEKEAYVTLYKELAAHMDEDDIVGIQLYPAGWPRKLQLSVGNIDLKNRIIVEGMELFGSHVEFSDDDSVVTKIVIKDAPMDWNEDIMMDTMSKYGDIVRTEKEMLYIEGRKTNCTTGTRYIFMSKLTTAIPSKLEVQVGVKTFPLSVWYRGQANLQNTQHVERNPWYRGKANLQNTQHVERNPCSLCGSIEHVTKSCSHSNKVCFTCHKSDHAHKDCPQNDGSKRSGEAMVFYNPKCPLSNWNKEYPFRVEDREYICVEQYIAEQKCNLFGDTRAARQVMKETNPKSMRTIGEDIRSYNHGEWMDAMHDVAYTGVQAKFTDERARGAREYLLDTGELVLGEATRNKKWGTGVHVSEPQALSHESWSGDNWMGDILMGIRQQLRPEPAKGSKNNGNDDDNSFLAQFRYSNDRTSQPPQWGLVIGDSNVKGLSLKDDSQPMNIQICAKGGNTLAHVPDCLGNSELNNEQVDVVALHVGTCEWDFGSEVEKGEDVYGRYMDAINVVSTQYPRAELLISSIPLRKPIGSVKDKAENINKQVIVLNGMLSELADKEDNIYFVDNTVDLHIDETKENLYSDSVHLNGKGRYILSNNLKNGLRESFAKSVLNLGQEWKDTHTSTP